MSKLIGKVRKNNNQAMKKAADQQEKVKTSRGKQQVPDTVNDKQAEQKLNEVDLSEPKALCEWLSEVVNTATVRCQKMSAVHQISR